MNSYIGQLIYAEGWLGMVERGEVGPRAGKRYYVAWLSGPESDIDLCSAWYTENHIIIWRADFRNKYGAI